MPLTIKHLNADTTFLITFTPAELPYNAIPTSGRVPGSFTILLDPWLSGASQLWHPKFLTSRHTVASCIENLSQIPEPNLVLISQGKPDHCHAPTLRQLNPTSNITTILAESSAAKRIHGMKHFDPSNVYALPEFSEKNPDTVIRFYIPPIVPTGSCGEVTISFMSEKYDVSGLHTAIGITYRPPSVIQPLPLQMPSTPPSSHNQKAFQGFPLTPPDSPAHTSGAISNSTASTSTSSSYTSHRSNSMSVSSVGSSMYGAHHLSGKTLSVIYSPHGVNYSLLRNYASSHLVPSTALPLTALLHSFDLVENPWWMGGNVNKGLPGGVEIAQNLMARCWISAHDEDKENSGLGVKQVRTSKYTQKKCQEMIQQVKASTSVQTLGVGQDICLKS